MRKALRRSWSIGFSMFPLGHADSRRSMTRNDQSGNLIPRHSWSDFTRTRDDGGLGIPSICVTAALPEFSGVVLNAGGL